MHRVARLLPLSHRETLPGAALRRALIPFALAVAMLVGGTPGATADIGWCRTDPGLAIAGETVNIFISAPQEILASATGPTAVVVYVPAGVAAEVLWTDPGFGYGETVTILESDRLRAKPSLTQITVEVFVPATTSLPVLVEIVPASAGVVTASESGATNGTVRIWTLI